MWLSALVASVSRRGPASSPASCRRRANAARRGRRSERTAGSLRTTGLLDQRRYLLADPLEGLLVLQCGAQRRVDERRVDRRRSQGGQRARPVERLGDAGDLVEVERAQALHQRSDLAGQPVGRLWRSGPDDRDLLLQVRVVDPVIQTAPVERVVHLTRAVRGDDHERRLAGADGAELGNRHLEVRQQLEEESLELLVGAVDLVDQQYGRSRVVVVDGVEQRSTEQELRAEDLKLGQAAVGRPVNVEDTGLAWPCGASGVIGDLYVPSTAPPASLVSVAVRVEGALPLDVPPWFATVTDTVHGSPLQRSRLIELTV